MTTQRRLVLGLVCALAALQVGSGARTQEFPHAALLRADGTVWQWTASGGGLQPVRGLTDATAAGLLGDEILTARVDGSTWLSRLDEGGGEPLPDAPRLHSIACGRGTCAAVTGTDHVVLWRGGSEIVPVQGIEDVAAVSVGDRHALALTHTGVVWAWGFNDRGQLGTDAVYETDQPVLVPGLRDVVSIAAGADVSAATLRDGSAWAWGANDAGQLGLADASDVWAAKLVPGFRSAIQVAAGGRGAFVLFQDGSAVPLAAALGGAEAVRISGEIVALHAAGTTVLAERADGAYWDLGSNRELTAATGAAPTGEATQETARDAASADAELATAEPVAPAEPAREEAGRAVLLTGGRKPSAVDLLVRDRLQRLGLQVEVVRQSDGFARLAGAALLVVSPSVQTNTLDARALKGLAVPMIVGERFLFEPLGLTTSSLLPIHGSENGRELSIVRPGHALAGGLDGRQKLLLERGAITTGEPAPSAVVVAVTTMGRAAIFGIEQGGQTAAGPAAARRVAFPLPVGESALSPQGVALFDAAARWAMPDPSEERAPEPEAIMASGDILLVVGSVPLTTGSADAVYKARMERLGFTVTPITAASATPTSAANKAMVFVSSSAPNGNVLNKFKTVTVPVAIQTGGIVDDMGMSLTNGQCTATSNQGTVVTSSHPIAMGLTGTLMLSAQAGIQEYGTPSASGVTILRCPSGTSSQGTGFTYVTGNVMADGTSALARRTMWSFYPPIPTSFTNTGADLFDRMLLWTTNSPNQAPIVDAGPNQSATTCETTPCTAITLSGHVFHDGLPTSTLTSIGWSVVPADPSVHFTAVNNEVTKVTFDNTGLHVLRLTANDGALVGSDDVTIEVFGQGSNEPPTVNAGADQFAEFPAVVTLVGTATDDGLPNPPGALTYQWTQVSGPGMTFGTPTAPSTAVTLPAEGTYVFRLTARDQPSGGSPATTTSLSPRPRRCCWSSATPRLRFPPAMPRSRHGSRRWASRWSSGTTSPS